nr:triple gene block protein 1 [Cowpea mild mottle virus]
MNELLTLLSKYNFTRLGHKLGDPIIINCVPGAGKSTLIRELLDTNDCFAAYSTVKADPPNLTGRRIEKLPSDLPSGKLIILDEYQNLSTIPSGIFAAFGDPLQTYHPLNLEATTSFLASPTDLEKVLRSCSGSYNFEVETEKEDTVLIEDIFEGELEGQVVCFEEEVVKLLKSHSVEFLVPQTLQGLTFKSVTFVTTGSITEANQHFHLICLTRHSVSLKILSPGAVYPN